MLELVDGVPPPPPGVGAFRHDIVSGKVGAFIDAQRDLTGAAREFSGYEGTSLFVDEDRETALSVLRFRTDRQLSAWVSSRERGAALSGLRSSLTHDFETMSSTTAFGTTVRNDHGRIRQTPNWKSAMMVLLVLYPTVMVLSRFLGPVLDRIGGPAVAGVVAESGRERRIDAVVAHAVGGETVPPLAGSGGRQQPPQQSRRRRG